MPTKPVVIPDGYDATDVHPLVREHVTPSIDKEGATVFAEITMAVVELALRQSRRDERASMRLLDLATIGFMVETGLLKVVRDA